MSNRPTTEWLMPQTTRVKPPYGTAWTPGKSVQSLGATQWDSSRLNKKSMKIKKIVTWGNFGYPREAGNTSVCFNFYFILKNNKG